MLDIKFVRANPDAVKENIKKKFQDEKIPMVDEVIEFDAKYRAAKTRCDELRAQRNKKSKEIGGLMAKGQKDEAEKVKAEVKAMADELEEKLPEQQPIRREGYAEGRWIVLDYGSVLVHIFHEQEREYYHMERLWMDGTNQVEVPEE